MAIQPIQLPGNMGIGRGIESLTESLRGLNDWQRQRKQDVQEQQRQQRAGFADAWMKAQSLMHKGDFDGAKMLLAPYSKDIQVSQQEIAPSMPMSTQGQQFQGGSAMPDQLEMDPSARVRSPQEMLANRMGREPAAGDLSMQPGPRGMPLIQPNGPQLTDAETFEQFAKTDEPAPTNPLIAARQAQVAQDKATDARRYRTLLRGTGPDGQSFSIDPEAQREARIGRLDASFAEGDQLTKEIYGQLRPVLMSSNQDVDVGDVLRFVNQEKENRARTSAAEMKEQQRLAEKKSDYEQRKADEAERDKRNFGQSKELAYIAAAAARGRQEDVASEKKINLEVLDSQGGVIGLARSEPEARELRTARTALEKARLMAADLKAKLAEGRLLPFFQSGKENDREIIISQLTEFRKQITGAENQSDAAKYKAQLSTAWNRGPEEAMAGVDQFLRGAEVGYDANVRSTMRKGLSGQQPAPSAGPRKPANKLVRARGVQVAKDILEGE